jgi:hypothetical protein
MAATLATFDYRYAPQGDPLGPLTGPLIERMLTATCVAPMSPRRPRGP